MWPAIVGVLAGGVAALWALLSRANALRERDNARHAERVANLVAEDRTSQLVRRDEFIREAQRERDDQVRRLEAVNRTKSLVIERLEKVLNEVAANHPDVAVASWRDAQRVPVSEADGNPDRRDRARAATVSDRAPALVDAGPRRDP